MLLLLQTATEPEPAPAPTVVELTPEQLNALLQGLTNVTLAICFVILCAGAMALMMAMGRG